MALPTSTPAPVPSWAIDVSAPAMDNTQSVGGLPANGGAAFGVLQSQMWPWGLTSADVQYFIGTTASAGSGTIATMRGGHYLIRTGRTAEVGSGNGNCGAGIRIPGWIPVLDPAIGYDDPNQRISWLRAWVLAGGADTDPGVANALGIGLIPDDGRAYGGSTTWPWTAATGFGGFGIAKRAVAGGLLNYFSYAAGGALLEATNLPSTAGWHCADFIIRSARHGDATTPWMTFRWDNVDIFTRRVFGSAFLQAPGTAVANAHGWALFIGCQPATTGQLSCYWRFRTGRFHPDGYEEPV